MESAIASIIVGVLALMGTIISNLISNSKTQYRIEQLEKKQDKHNCVIERVTILEHSFRADESKLDTLARDVEAMKLSLAAETNKK